MRVLIEDTSFYPDNDWIGLTGIQWLSMQPRDLWLRVQYSSAFDFTIWACATREQAAAHPQPPTSLASLTGSAGTLPASFILRSPEGASFCAVRGSFYIAETEYEGPVDPPPDVLWAYMEDALGGAILGKAAEILRSYAYPGGALGGIQPHDITIGPGTDAVSSLPAVHLEARAPSASLDLHPGVVGNYGFEVVVRTPGPVPGAWRAAIEYARAIVSILADEHRRDVPAGILCRYVSGDGPIPDGPSEGGRRCSMTFEVVGIEGRPQEG